MVASLTWLMACGGDATGERPVEIAKHRPAPAATSPAPSSPAPPEGSHVEGAWLALAPCEEAVGPTCVPAVAPTTIEVAGAEAQGAPGEPASVRVRLSPEGASVLASLTERHLGRRLAIVVRRGAGRATVDEVLSAPVVMEPITGGAFVVTMTSGASRDAAEQLALQLRQGGAAAR
jgi:preprotein translocase subunit SecD